MSSGPIKGPAWLEHDWFPAPLPANVELGERSWIETSYAFLHYRSERPCGLRVGDDSGVYLGTFFNLGPEAEVEVGDYCTLVAPVFSTNGRVTIDDYALIAAEVLIADSPFSVPGGFAGGLSTEIEIGARSWIGARAAVLSGARIGEGAIVGAGAVVDFEVPGYAVVAGNPSRVVGRAPPKSPDER